MTDIPDYQQIFKVSFSARLINKLREKGFISNRGTHKVNGQKLADGIGVSLPMARRYINAKSIPENTTLQKIANWLGVDPFWLLYGDNGTNSASMKSIDKILFKEIFEQLFPQLCNPNLSKEKYREIIAGCLDIYNHIIAIDASKPKERATTLMVSFLKNKFTL